MNNIKSEYLMDNHQDLEQSIKEAFKILYDRDRHLIINEPEIKSYCLMQEKKNNHSDLNLENLKYYVGERAIVFRFAHYLQNLIERDYGEYNLDCEYNRNGFENKSLPSFPNGTFPDLIIHKRGSNDSNLLIMEFKTWWNTRQDDDRNKVMEFTCPCGKYHYDYGAVVLIGKNSVKIEWYGLNIKKRYQTIDLLEKNR